MSRRHVCTAGASVVVMAGLAVEVRATPALDADGARAAVEHIAREHPFSGSVLVAKNGRTLVQMTIGYADRARGRRARIILATGSAI